MKRYFFLLSVIIFTMCTPGKNKLDPVEEKQAEQLKSGLRRETLFMDFDIGLSVKQTFEKFRKYAVDSTFIIKKNGVFEYNMKLDNKVVRVAFHTNFYHDSLYAISLIMKGKDEPEARRNQQGMVQMVAKEFGNPVEIPSASDKTKIDYYFISGNQQVKVEYPDAKNRTIITYADYTMEKRRAAEDQLRKEALQKKNIKKPSERGK